MASAAFRQCRCRAKRVPTFVASQCELTESIRRGYNSWYDLLGALNETNLKETADRMVDLGLLDLGYSYFNLDDDWASVERYEANSRRLRSESHLELTERLLCSPRPRPRPSLRSSTRASDRNDKDLLVADPTRFTGGSLKALGDYVHGKGMLFGTYTDRGTKTCGGKPGALGHEKVDAQTYASWGVDYLKEDC